MTRLYSDVIEKKMRIGKEINNKRIEYSYYHSRFVSLPNHGRARLRKSPGGGGSTYFKVYAGGSKSQTDGGLLSGAPCTLARQTSILITTYAYLARIRN